MFTEENKKHALKAGIAWADPEYLKQIYPGLRLTQKRHDEIMNNYYLPHQREQQAKINQQIYTYVEYEKEYRDRIWRAVVDVS